MVRKERLELSRVAPLAPKASASTVPPLSLLNTGTPGGTAHYTRSWQAPSFHQGQRMIIMRAMSKSIRSRPAPSGWRPALPRAALPRAALLAALLLGGCDMLRPRPPAPSPPVTAGSGDSAAVCADLDSEIRHNKYLRQQAPLNSTSPEINDDAIGKADQRIEKAQRRYTELGCGQPSSPTGSPSSPPAVPPPRLP